MLLRLAEGERAASELAHPFPVSQPAVSQQLRVLKEAGLVSERREGRRRLYRLEPAALGPVFDFAERMRCAVTDPSGHILLLRSRPPRRPRGRGRK